MNILVVDDEKEIASLFQEYLESGGGHEIRVAHSGEEALGKIKQQKPDLIILDVLMPGLTGLQVLDTIKRNAKTADIPIVLSSIIDGPWGEDKKRLGIVDFLKKPVDFAKLDLIIQQQLGRGNRSKKKSRTVLLIEDDQDAQSLISMELLNLGCIVRSAMDGFEGVRVANQIKPDLIILDYLLPIKIGIDVIKELKANRNTCDIPIVLISSYILTDNKEKSFFLLDNTNTGAMSVEEMCKKIKDIFSFAA